MTVVEKHPQRAEIIEAILSGETLRSIAKRVVPPLNHVSLSRFRMKLVAPAINGLRGKTGESKRLSEIAESAGIVGDSTDPQTKVRELVKQQIQSTIIEGRERRERWLSEAERRPVLDKLGNPVLDSDGSVLRVLEHKALAAHDRNNLSSLELQAKLAGLLVSDQAPAGDTNLVLSLPRVTVVLQQGATAVNQPAPRVIDVASGEPTE